MITTIMNQVHLFENLRSTAMNLEHHPDNRRAFDANFDNRLTLDQTMAWTLKLDSYHHAPSWPLQLPPRPPLAISSCGSPKISNLKNFTLNVFQTPCVVQSCAIAQKCPSIESFLKR